VVRARTGDRHPAIPDNSHFPHNVTRTAAVNGQGTRVRAAILLVTGTGDPVVPRISHATLQRPDPAAEPFPETWLKGELNAKKEELTNIAEGIFKPWSKSPTGWVLGGSAPIALVDVWIRWWTFA
jgi:hypothetical protein